MQLKITVLPGDGIGPEIAEVAIRLIKIVGERYNINTEFITRPIGGASIDQYGVPLTDDTLEACYSANAVLLGAVGGEKWENLEHHLKPEAGLLKLRKSLGLYANLRPAKIYPSFSDASSLKTEVLEGTDFVVVRELTGGIYFGEPKKQWRTAKGRQAVDTMAYSEAEIERILKVGFEVARSRRKKLISVAKANVLQSSRLWRQIAIEMSAEYPDVELQHMLVDACAMRLIQRPSELDVVVTENTFGDILTDEASMLAGSMGMLPSASLAGIPSGKTFGMYEPIHGSAPSRAGQDLANPIATILSVAMMLRRSFALETEAQAVEDAVLATLEQGYRTYDIMSEGKTRVGTIEMGQSIMRKVRG